jgi:hypothetical protein
MFVHHLDSRSPIGDKPRGNDAIALQPVITEQPGIWTMARRHKQIIGDKYPLTEI